MPKKHKLKLKKRAQRRLKKSLASKSKRLKKEKSRQPSVNIGGTLNISFKTLSKAHRFPIYECLIGDSWQEQGLAYILLSRQAFWFKIVGIYLVDTMCLGLKDTFVSAFRFPHKYDQFKKESKEKFKRDFTLIETSYELVNAIIYGGIDYAQNLGFSPHKDFQMSRHVLGPKIKTNEEVRFGGENGKPFYIAGPHDNYTAIMEQLSRTLGKAKFEYLLPVDMKD